MMASGRRYLVTGASGFLGEVVTRLLASRGERVVGLYRQNPLDIPGAVMLPADLADGEGTRKLLDDVRPHVIIHTAAQTNVGYSQSHPDEAKRDIIDATHQLTDSAMDVDPSIVFVHVSTDQVYDGVPRNGAAPYDLSHSVRPLSVYGQMKLDAEDFARRFDQHAIVRTALIYGPKGTHRGSFLEWLADGIARGDRMELFIDEIRTPIFVEDLAHALIALGETRHRTCYLAGGPDRLSRHEMGLRVAKLLGADPSCVVAANLSETKTPAPRPADLALDSRPLWEDVQREPISFAEGLGRALASRTGR
jgi:dTDP-4-dehydrorhamnose reductase